ncbi:MAG: response regulator [Synechococcales bacterium]|nr:response regulator [Synechococcales bacterium]
MSHSIPDLASISHHLTRLERLRKPKLLVVDDEPDNLDLLYRTFRREFQVLKAESGVAALEILANEGEVAVIISDQRMPEMKGTEFLSKTVPQFPNTVRIILTGFTDVEDLVEAINSGQVFKYITKPWDPAEMKAVVQRAIETYELLQQRTIELQRANVQVSLLKTIVQASRESSDLASFMQTIADAFGNGFGADMCVLQKIEQGALVQTSGVFSCLAGEQPLMQDDPLVQAAIASQTIQIADHIAKEAAFSTLDYYTRTGINSQIVIPFRCKGEVAVVLSLQWVQPFPLQVEEVTSLHLLAHQVALSMACCPIQN